MKCVSGKLFTEKKFLYGRLWIEQGLIKKLEPCEADELTEKEKNTKVLPGLVDLHSHGANGIDVCNATEVELCKLAKFEKANGVTSYFPATMTLGKESLLKACGKIAKASEETGVVKGIYLEGPFVSKEKCGSQNPAFAIKPDMKLLEELNLEAKGLISFVTLAAELEGAKEFIKEAGGKYRLTLGHSKADYELAKEAFELGIDQVTHLYNAMDTPNHRAPGIPFAALEKESVMVELIGDGLHVHPAYVRAAFKSFGEDRIILISDSTSAAGAENKDCWLGDKKILKADGLARLEDGIIAGSASTLFDCLKTCIAMGIEEKAAITAATLTPARAAGIDSFTGSLEIGKRADLLIVSDDYEILEVLENGN